MTNRTPKAGKVAAVLPWRIVAGAWLHFVLPVYIVVVPLACVLAPGGTSIEKMLGRAIPFSGWFLCAYLALAVVSTLGAAAIDPALRAGRDRRNARDPRVAARLSEERLTQAAADGRRLLGDRAAHLMTAIRQAKWDHDDSRFQALSEDIAHVVRTSAAALATAPVERRAAIADMAATSLADLQAGLQALLDERSRLDEGDARTVARYVETRYGSDSAGGDI